MKFRYNRDFLKRVLSEFSDNSYDFVLDPSLLKSGSGKVFLRHDIDVDLQRAITLRNFEIELGYHGVYFVMVNSPFYNPLSGDSLRSIQEFLDKNTCIGLHAYITNLVEWEKQIERQKQVLETVIGKPISLLSFHHPTRETIELNLSKMDILNVYTLNQTNDISYFSDSNMNLDFEGLTAAISANRNIHLLIHPVWWIDGFDDPSQLWPELISEKTKNLWDTVSMTERSFKSY